MADALHVASAQGTGITGRGMRVPSRAGPTGALTLPPTARATRAAPCRRPGLGRGSGVARTVALARSGDGRLQ